MIPADVKPTVKSCFGLEMLLGTLNLRLASASNTYTRKAGSNIVGSTGQTSSKKVRSTVPVSARIAHFVD